MTPSQVSAWCPRRASAPCSSGVFRGEKMSRSGTPSKLSSPSYQFGGGGGNDEAGDDAAAAPVFGAAGAVAGIESNVAVIRRQPFARAPFARAPLSRSTRSLACPRALRAAVQLGHHELAVAQRLGA